MSNSQHHWLWAKLGAATWPESYHPVICHLIDVGQVANHLWCDVLRKKVRAWVAGELGLTDDAAGAWLSFLVAAHDIGKLTPGFQHRGNVNTEPLWTRLSANGFDFPIGKPSPHGFFSAKILHEELQGRGHRWPALSESVSRNAAVAVGGHHGVFPVNWCDIGSQLGSGRWSSIRQEVLEELARLFCISDQPAPLPATPSKQCIWMFVAGLTSVADWIGSNTAFFRPHGNSAFADGPFDVDVYFGHADHQAVAALETLGWRGRDSTAPVRSIEDYLPLGGSPRPLQQTVSEIVGAITDPSLTIIEAPMGEGKTEAAWYAAACWDRQGGQGTYVALPTMATSNQMLDRVAVFLAKDDAGKSNLMLLHGKAALNEQFNDLKYAARIYDDETRPSAVVAEEWFASNKKHGLLAPYGVGTIDQALLAVLQTRHVFVRLFGLVGKCVILDEVHAYDAYMTTLLERLLSWLAALGCPVVLLSATLPKEKRLKLLQAYAGRDVAVPDHVAYPRITCAPVGGPVTVSHVQADKDRERSVQLGWLDESALADQLRTSLADGGCAAVIRNTVGLAQRTYLKLRDALAAEGITVELFHARFPFGRRQRIETGVLQRFGKDGGPEERHKRVLIATQVVEQSLDLDFDVMISDVAPVDLVLQRAGRLHRHDRGARPAGVNTPRLFLIKPPIEDGLPDYGPSEYVYARYVLLRSHVALDLVLQAVGAIQLPDDLERFVEQVYGTERLAIPDDWQTALEICKCELNEKQRTQRSKAKGIMIYRPDDEDVLRQQNAQLDEDNPEAAEKIRAATRDTEPSIQVILVYHLDGRDYLDRSGQAPFSEAEEPNLRRVRRLLDNEVTINHRGCVGFYVRVPVPPGWQERGMLRHHRLLRLDRSGTSLSSEYPLRFDPEIGVMFTRDTAERANQ